MLREARFISPFALGCNETRSEWRVSRNTDRAGVTAPSGPLMSPELICGPLLLASFSGSFRNPVLKERAEVDSWMAPVRGSTMTAAACVELR